VGVNADEQACSPGDRTVIKTKLGVRPRSLTIAAAVANVAALWGVTVTITSGEDGRHMPGSRHGTGDALDVRSRAPFKGPVEKRAFLAAVLSRLGASYDGILEDEGGKNEHFHIEHDPR
ncbi:MAG: hypothetical protein VW405_15810, partial [Rhodospirillaceae bacterium]